MKMNIDKTPQYCEIVDRYKLTIIASGLIIDTKTVGKDKSKDDVFEESDDIKVNLISLDGKYFFHADGTEKYYINFKTKDEMDGMITYQEMPNYKMKLWRDIKETDGKSIDVYREFDITEIDSEVKNLVDALNELDGLRTTGSCSGHGVDSAWVTMLIDDFNTMSKLMRILQHRPTHFYDMFDIQIDSPNTIEYEFNNPGKEIPLQIRTKGKGEEAYDAVRKLAEYLNKMIDAGYFTSQFEEITYYNNRGKQSFQWELWAMCNNLCKYCCIPGTKVLMSDYTEKNIEDVKEGDTVFGVMAEDLIVGGNKRFILVPATVLGTSKREYTGKIYGNFTDNHPMMEGAPFNNEYVDASLSTIRTIPTAPHITIPDFTSEYKRGYVAGCDIVTKDTVITNDRYLSFVAEGIKGTIGGDDPEYCKGYICGMYDEYGTLSVDKAYIILNSKHQEGEEIDYTAINEAKRCLDILGFTYTEEYAEARKAILIQQDRYIEFIETIVPNDVNKRYCDDSYRYTTEEGALTESDYSGYVYNLQTGTENYIADGYAVHNCYLGTENRHTDKIRQMKSLNDCYKAICDLDLNIYNNISLIGGEFFQGQLDDPEVHDAFMKIMDKCCDYYSAGLIGSVWITVTLTLGDQKHLYEVLDKFEERKCYPKKEYGASGLWLCTSWDAEGRFHTQKHADNWDYHMKHIHEVYPWVKFNTTTIIMQKLVDMYLADEWSPKRFMEEYHTTLFFKQCGLGQVNFSDYGDETVPWRTKYDLAKHQQQKDFGFDFFPTRASFLKFLRKYATDDPDTYDRLFNIAYRADELHRNFNDKNEDVANKRDKHSANESDAEQDNRFNTCGHILNYAPYIDCNKCCICDRNMIWDTIHGDERRR